MAIAPTVLTSNISTTDATSFTTANPALDTHQNQLITIAVMSAHASALPNIPTFTTAQGGTWTQVESTTASTAHVRLSIFESDSASFTNGALIIDFAGQTQTVCAWDITAWTGTRATAANNGADGIGVHGRTSFNTTATSITVDITGSLSTGSATYAASTHAANEGTTPGSGYAELSDKSIGSPATGFETEWASTASLTIAASWASNVGGRIIAGTEILPAFSGTGAVAVAAASLSATGREAFKESGGIAASAASLAATGREDFKATGGLGAPAASIAAAGSARFVGTGAEAAAAASLSGTGSERFISSGGVTAAASSLQGTASQEQAGVGAFAGQPASFSGQGAEVFTSVGAFGAAPAELAGTAGQGIFGVGDFQAAPAALAGTGSVAEPQVQGTFGGGGGFPRQGTLGRDWREQDKIKAFPPPAQERTEPPPEPQRIVAAGGIVAKPARIAVQAYNEPPEQLLAYGAFRSAAASLTGEGSQDLRPAVDVLTRQLDDAVLLALL